MEYPHSTEAPLSWFNALKDGTMFRPARSMSGIFLLFFQLCFFTSCTRGNCFLGCAWASHFLTGFQHTLGLQHPHQHQPCRNNWWHYRSPWPTETTEYALLPVQQSTLNIQWHYKEHHHWGLDCLRHCPPGISGGYVFLHHKTQEQFLFYPIGVRLLNSMLCWTLLLIMCKCFLTP